MIDTIKTNMTRVSANQICDWDRTEQRVRRAYPDADLETVYQLTARALNITGDQREVSCLGYYL